MPGAQRGGSTRWQHGRADGREEREWERGPGTRMGGSERAGSPPGDAGTAAPAPSRPGCEDPGVFPSLTPLVFCLFVRLFL